MEPEPGAKFYRSIFISDVHLGSRGSKADFLLDFLKSYSAILMVIGSSNDDPIYKVLCNYFFSSIPLPFYHRSSH